MRGPKGRRAKYYPKKRSVFSGILFRFTSGLKFDELIIVLPRSRLYSRQGNNQAIGMASFENRPWILHAKTTAVF
jgi:hypothetical protein